MNPGVPEGTCKKCLKIPKGQSEAVNRRRTDNAMSKRKKDKRTNNDLQNIRQKNQRSSCFCSTNGTRRITPVNNPVISYGRGQQGDEIDYEKTIYAENT